MRTWIAALLAAFAAMDAASAVTSSVEDIPVAGGTQRFLYVRPEAPIAIVVVISGGDGTLGIQADGSMGTVTAMCGPVTRNRLQLAEAGFALALVDANSNGVVYQFGDILAVVRFMEARHNVPVWVTGGSASTATVAGLASNLPADIRAGVVFYSPARLPATVLAAITRPAVVISHALDALAAGSFTFNALTSVVVKDRAVLTGGSDAPPCGYHLYNGIDAEFTSRFTEFIRRYNASTSAASPNYQALWYASPAESEPGWGVNIAHQGDTLFATWFTYDAAGPMWLVMSNGTQVSPKVYRGSLYRTTGPAFSATPFDPSRVAVTEVGTATFDFTAGSVGTFSYTVNGVSGAKQITRQVFASPVPQCGAGSAPSATNYQDLWWVPAESGWGVNLTHQGDILFGTWFTYGADGAGRWLVMPSLNRVGTGSRYAGDMYRTTGTPFSAYDPSRLTVIPAGTASFEFTGGSTATFTYSVDGFTQAKSITRQSFGAPTLCR
jgi:hypothetical protein